MKREKAREISSRVFFPIHIPKETVALATRKIQCLNQRKIQIYLHIFTFVTILLLKILLICWLSSKVDNFSFSCSFASSRPETLSRVVYINFTQCQGNEFRHRVIEPFFMINAAASSSFWIRWLQFMCLPFFVIIWNDALGWLIFWQPP